MASSFRQDWETLRTAIGSLPPPSEEFDLYRRRHGVLAARLGLLGAAIAVLLWLPTDPIVHGGDPAQLRQVIAFQVGFLALSFLMYLALGRTPLSYAMGVVAVCFILLATYAFGYMGMIAGPEVPFLFTIYFVPATSLIFPFSIQERAFMASASASLALAAYEGPHTAYWTYSHNDMIGIFLTFSTLASIVFGHVLYLFQRTLFEQRRKAEEQTAQLEEVNRMKDAFVATVSHELRTPLNAILGLTEAILDEENVSEVRRYARTIYDSGDLLLSLINDILDLAKIRAGKLDFTPAPTDVADVIERCSGYFFVSCRKKGILLDVNVPAGLPRVLADRSRLSQILMNLIGNAVKFTDEGGIQVSAVLARGAGRREAPAEAEDGTSPLIVTVSDSGPGVPAHQREAVFEEFKQLDMTSTRKKGGTGLGLPIVRRLARLMGGDVVLTERAGGGSVFTLTLPLEVVQPAALALEKEAAPAALPSPRPAAPAPSSQVGAAALGSARLKLLVVDDVPENRLVIQVFLRDAPCDVVLAESGAQAIALCRETRFDVVLLDIEMPEMDGYAALQEIRRLEREIGRARTPVAALTAHGSFEHQARTREAGFDIHLTKPFRKNELFAALGRLAGHIPLRSVSRPLRAISPAPTPEVGPELVELSALRDGYLQKRMESLPQLREHARARRYPELVYIGHNWSGSGTSYGFPEITRLGAALERAARKGEAAEVDQIVAEIGQLFAAEPAPEDAPRAGAAAG